MMMCDAACRAGLLLGVASLAACADSAPVPRPAIQANPAPAKFHEIRIDVGALPVDVISGIAQYDIGNHQECVQATALSGITDPNTQRLPLAFTKNASGQFVAKLVGDPFLDADYYGQGPCHWVFTAATFRLAGRLPTQGLWGVWRKDLSADGVDRVHVDYCAAEPAYTHAGPANFCELDLGRVDAETRRHLFAVTTYNRRLTR
jgi:hypothetical protein